MKKTLIALFTLVALSIGVQSFAACPCSDPCPCHKIMPSCPAITAPCCPTLVPSCPCPACPIASPCGYQSNCNSCCNNGNCGCGCNSGCGNNNCCREKCSWWKFWQNKCCCDKGCDCCN